MFSSMKTCATIGERVRPFRITVQGGPRGLGRWRGRQGVAGRRTGPCTVSKPVPVLVGGGQPRGAAVSRSRGGGAVVAAGRQSD